MSYSFDRQFQQRLELVFKKAEYDRMQEQRQERARQAQQQAAANDACPQKKQAKPSRYKLG